MLSINNMITLGTGQELHGESSTSNIGINLFGEDASGPRILYTGFFQDLKLIFTATSPTRIQDIHLYNVNATTTFKIYAGGTSQSNRVFTADLPVGGYVIYNSSGWRIYGPDGLPAGSNSNNYFP